MGGSFTSKEREEPRDGVQLWDELDFTEVGRQLSIMEGQNVTKDRKVLLQDRRVVVQEEIV